jgi:hypothetical protein
MPSVREFDEPQDFGGTADGPLAAMDDAEVENSGGGDGGGGGGGGSIGGLDNDLAEWNTSLHAADPMELLTDGDGVSFGDPFDLLIDTSAGDSSNVTDDDDTDDERPDTVGPESDATFVYDDVCALPEAVPTLLAKTQHFAYSPATIASSFYFHPFRS